MRSQPNRLFRWVILAGLAVAAAGCAEFAADAESKSSGTFAEDTVYSDTSAGAQGPWNAGGADASGSWGAGGAKTDNDDMGIGLKPGGAQDIAFFRQKLLGGAVPQATDMTLSGWLNEHDTILPPALKDRLVTLHAQAAVHQDEVGKQDVVVQLGFNSGLKLDAVQAKLGLIVVVDTSGSMAGDKMFNAKEGVKTLVQNVPANTQLGIVRFSSDATVAASVTQVTDGTKQGLNQAIDQLYADGGTNLHGGLELGKSLCGDIQGAEIRRIVLLSDGQPSAGNTDPNAMIALAKSAAKAGCSVSTVGLGYDFAPQLMTSLAEQGEGTAWFVPDAQSAKTVFVQDLETLLLPVAEKLQIQLELGQGWKIASIPGFAWAQEGSKVSILGPKADPLPGQTDEPEPNPGTDQPETGTDEPVSVPTLFASKKNGLVLLELTPPAGDTWTLATQLWLGTVQYNYTEKKTQQQASFEVPLSVPGLIDVPDAGLQYFGSPAVRRARLLLRDGQALQAGCALFHAGDQAASVAALQAALAFHDAEVAALQPDLLSVDGFAPNLADARSLLQTLLGVTSAQ